MAVQFSVAVRNARLNTVESTIGTAAVLRLFTGAPPASCASADPATKCADMTLPSDWMDAANAGAKAILGTWQDTSADNPGTIGCFRIYESTGATCHIQGTVSTVGADMNLDNNVVTAGQQITVTSFTLTDGNA